MDLAFSFISLFADGTQLQKQCISISESGVYAIMGNGTSRVVGCLVPFNGKSGVDLEFLEPLGEGLGHSFCYVRPSIFEPPAITPSNSKRFTLDSSTLDSENFSGSFRHDSIE